MCLFDVAFCAFFCFSLDYFILLLFVFVVLGLVYSVLAKILDRRNVSEMTKTST